MDFFQLLESRLKQDNCSLEFYLCTIWHYTFCQNTIEKFLCNNFWKKALKPRPFKHLFITSNFTSTELMLKWY